jgi:hypothetical protein
VAASQLVVLSVAFPSLCSVQVRTSIRAGPRGWRSPLPVRGAGLRRGGKANGGGQLGTRPAPDPVVRAEIYLVVPHIGPRGPSRVLLGGIVFISFASAHATPLLYHRQQSPRRPIAVPLQPSRLPPRRRQSLSLLAARRAA